MDLNIEIIELKVLQAEISILILILRDYQILITRSLERRKHQMALED